MNWIPVLFYVGLTCAAIAQVINFSAAKPKDWKRIVGMICGIVAVFAIAAAGKLTSNKVAAAAEEARTAANKAGGLVSFVNAVLQGGGL